TRRFDPPRRQAVLRHFDELAAAVPRHRMVEAAAHGDFNPENILLDGESVWVLDFADVGRGAPVHDLTHLYGYLDTVAAKPWVSARAAARLQGALLRGFDPSLTPSDPLFR